jgi:SAM-dependent methyltransferase
MDDYKYMGDLLWYGVKDKELKSDQELAEEQRLKLESGGLSLFRELANDEEFEAHDELVAFISFDIWHTWVLTQEISEGSPAHQAQVNALQKKKELLLPILSDVATRSASKNELARVETIMEVLGNIGDEKAAETILFDEAMDDESMLTTAVAHINTFGFIDTIDKMAARIKDEGEEKSGKLSKLYAKLQGEEALNIVTDLSEIYEKIDFSEYTVNTSELTKEEVDLLVDHVRRNKDSQILDVGAGTGRHALELRQRGYTNVIAFEHEQKHIDFMRSQDPEMTIVKGDWTHLKTYLTEGGIVHLIKHEDGTLEKQPQKMKLVYSLGRTLAHNRTPEAMFQTFDQVLEVLDEEGKFVFDMPDVNWGVYQERVQHLRSTLEELGVKSTETGRIFDGPTDVEKFHRMIIMPQQAKALADMLGYKIVEKRTEQIEDDINNIYYVFEQDPDFDASRITPDEHQAALVDLGLLEPGSDLNTYVEAWGMTIGQSLIFRFQMGLDNPHIRYMNENGRSPQIRIYTENGVREIETEGIPTSDHRIAVAAAQKGKEVYAQFRQEYDSAESPEEKRRIREEFTNS